MKLKKSKPALIVAILFKHRGAVGGMAQRFSLVGAKLIESNASIELLTTRSLQDEFSIPNQDASHIIEDTNKKITINSWIMLLNLIIQISIGKYRQVHLAGAGRLSRVIVMAAKLSGTKLSCTFASRTLGMASYGRELDKLRWVKLLDAVDAIDVLNPSHDLHKWKEKVSISPCSFPSKKDHLPKNVPTTKKKVAVFSGALERNKNPLLAMDIIYQYWKVYDEAIELVIFGKGTLEVEIQQRMQKFNNEVGFNLIRFGSFEELPSALKESNIFFSLQEFDNYPSQSLMEAMLMGCKVIATDEGDTALMLAPQEPLNSLVASRDPVAFLPGLHQANLDLRSSNANIQYISKNHSISRFMDYLKTFLGENNQ